MTAKQIVARNRILIIAVAASLAWHVLWLSVCAIVAPNVTQPVRFSRVAFLGPILERGVMEVRVTARERTFLENRYLDLIQRSAPETTPLRRGPVTEDLQSDAFNARLVTIIDDTVSGSKLEPPGEL
jgi:hypothetical protein